MDKYPQSYIDALNTEIARLKEANEAWHRRVEQLLADIKADDERICALESSLDEAHSMKSDYDYCREKLELAESAVKEWSECESIRNGDLVETLEALIDMDTRDSMTDPDRILTDEGRAAVWERARKAIYGECPKCGGVRKGYRLPAFADACDCERAAGVDLKPREHDGARSTTK